MERFSHHGRILLIVMAQKTVKGAKQTPPNTPLALKELNTKKRSTFSLWVT